MIKFKNIAPIALVALLLSGCKEALNESELPKTTDKLIVLCAIAPNEPIEVILDVAKPILGKYDPGDGYDYSNSDTTRYLRSAQVMLTDLQTGQQVQLVFDTACQANRQTFIVPIGEQFDIVPGHEYRLNAEYKGCPPVSATTMVPAGDFSIENVNIVIRENDIQWNVNAYIEVHNDTNEPATYLVDGGINIESTFYHTDFHFVYEYDSIGVAHRLKDSLGNNIIIANWKVRQGANELNSHTKNHIQAPARGKASGTIEIGAWLLTNKQNEIGTSGDQWDSFFTNINSFHVTAKHLNNDYVRYHSAWNTDDIFMLFSKPPAGYSNIDGGLGIFCAWMTKAFEITDFQIF